MVATKGLDIPRRLRLDVLQRHVAGAFGLTKQQLVSQSRRMEVVGPRHVAIYIAYRLLSYSTPVLARHFNYADHTTVLHAIKSVEQTMVKDADLEKFVKRLTAEINHSLKIDADTSKHIGTLTGQINAYLIELAKDDPETLLAKLATLVPGPITPSPAPLTQKPSPPAAANPPKPEEEITEPDVDTQEPEPAEEGTKAAQTKDIVSYLQQEDLMVYRDFKFPDKQLWYVEGKGFMDRDAMTAYANTFRKRDGLALFRTAAIAAVLVFLLSLPAPAAAQLACNDRAQIAAYIRDIRNQRPVSEALTHKNTLAETFVGPDRAWSIILTDINGLSCLFMEGSDYEGPMPPPPEKGERQ